jgi:hypothetical protein
VAPAALGQYRDLEHCLAALCAGGWCWPEAPHHIGAGPSQAGTRAQRSLFQRVSISCFSRPTRQSCSPANISGRSPTKRLPIVASRPSMDCKKRKSSGVSFFRMIRAVYVSIRSSTGGLPHAHKSRMVRGRAVGYPPKGKHILRMWGLSVIAMAKMSRPTPSSRMVGTIPRLWMKTPVRTNPTGSELRASR